ncbi:MULTISPECIES: FAD-binding and (Fe-S)-binding domain-containing protein [Rhodomicrobium]|uniref:FAD-binding and (Fe-S)-binding domain-containing protein n=1 Tax=Rhodomicrobium TaxID=1068 RepID=UPI000B4BF345|nr:MULTISPECIES: FAD-binding and (Fe-S)-binding domain-containing protein [Rhodomicrobium]
MAGRMMPVLERRLKSGAAGEILTDAFSRGRYATDASHYQIMPTAISVPGTIGEAENALAIALSEGVSVVARGGGTSQCGQTVNDGLVIDCSKNLTRLISLDAEARRCTVEPGIVLDELNRALKPHGLWFPVDVSTASRATIGGMTANNSCGGRSLRYGTMRDNVISAEAVLADGRKAHFGRVRADLSDLDAGNPLRDVFADLIALGAREADEVAARMPAVQRRVGGYNIDALSPRKSNDGTVNLAHILVGSEGTLAFTTAVELKLWPLLGRRGVGVCHFGSFHKAMESAQHLVTLKPIAVELVDSTMIALASGIAIFRPTFERVVRGEPEALLIVEFAEDEAENLARLRQLHEMMGDLGFGWDKSGARWGGVVDILDPALQASLTDVRTSGLNIMMSMKDARKPVSFVEDCAVPLEHLADYTARLAEVFERHGTRGTWYAHASEGCLHVRPVLNLKLDKDVAAMRAIAEEAFALVRAYKGSHSGEHGDGLVRSEFHEVMFGSRLVRAFEEVKDRFDPRGLMNPGKIVRAPKFDDRSNFRFAPAYRFADIKPALDWSEFPGPAAGFAGAVEMCNNNGACRKLEGGAMCPSYRVTRNERDLTRGRANSLRLALSGQLGRGALGSDEMAETMKLCVSCKACRRECPTSVDMARMKIEVLAARAREGRLSLRDRLVAYLPRYAPYAARVPWLLNLRDAVPGLARLSEAALGLAAKRPLPRWRGDIFREAAAAVGLADGPEVVLWADSFNRAYDPEIIDAAINVLVAGGYRVHLPRPAEDGRPLCCGRTFLAAGLVDQARYEAIRTLAALAPFAERGVPIVGLEPSCLFTFRDEMTALGLGAPAREVAARAVLFEEFLAREDQAKRLQLPLAPLPRKALLHGHCHQKAFGAMGAVEAALRLVPELSVKTVESSCCGMAGAFGYQAETVDISLAMAELSLLPAVRAAPADTLIVADGTSCRHQIADGSGRRPIHVAQLLAMSLTKPGAPPQGRNRATEEFIPA